MSESANDMLPAIQTPAKSARTPRVGGKTKAAIDLMVWEGLTDNQAAVKTGITIVAIRLALKQPHYRAYLRSQCEMLRLRESPRNIHTYVDVRDNSGNSMARIAAAKALDGQTDQQVSSGLTRSPGVVIQILGNASVSQIDATLTHPMTIDHQSADISDG